MGFLRRIADRFDPQTEQRAADPSWAALSGHHGDFTSLLTSGQVGGAIPPHLAENLSTVLACVNAVSGAISSLPVWFYNISGEGRSIDKDFPLARLVREGPNQHQSWPEFIEGVTAQLLLNGNALVEIKTQARSGEVIELIPHAWTGVAVRLLPSGRLAYDITPVSSVYGSTGETRRLLDSDVLHLRDRSDDGLVGRSRLSRASGPVRTGLTQETFGEILYANRGTPSGLISVSENLSDMHWKRIQDGVEQSWRGVRNAGRVFVLEGGAKYTPITVSPESLEMLATRRFSTEEVARLFGVPPPIVGIWDHSTFTNSETAGRWFAQFTLAPIIRKIEEAFRRSVFTAEARRTHEMEIDLSGFLRGDAETRWRNHEIAARNGILTTDEIRESEGWAPRREVRM
ncbi:MAG: phage portal protein [Pseudomonadota bacterium]